jgi:hypothetical protein
MSGRRKCPFAGAAWSGMAAAGFTNCRFWLTILHVLAGGTIIERHKEAENATDYSTTLII